MAYNYTSEELINSVKIKTSIPSNQSVLSDEDILMIADEELRMNLVPLLLSTNEDYFVHVDYVPLVSGQTEYEIPYRAISSKVREIGWRSSPTSNDYYPLHRISIDDIYSQPSGRLQYFYLVGDKIVLHSDGSSGGYLAIYYPFRPNRLVLTDNVGKILSITKTTTDITFELDKSPENFAVNVEYDFIKNKSNHGVICYDKIATQWNSGNSSLVISNTSDVDFRLNEIKVGDIVALSNQTNIVACPTDLQPILAQTVASQVLSSIGDTENLQTSNAKLQKMEGAGYILAENRVVGSSVKIANRNGLVNSRLGWNRRIRGL